MSHMLARTANLFCYAVKRDIAIWLRTAH